MYIVSIRAGLAKLNEKFEEKYARLEREGRLTPTWLEKLMGLTLLLCNVANTYYKTHSMTVIFMFNPCHIVSVSEPPTRPLKTSASP